MEPKLVVDTLLCPKCIVSDLCSHVSVQGKWLVLNYETVLYLEVSLGYRVILNVKYGGGGGGVQTTPGLP